MAAVFISNLDTSQESTVEDGAGIVGAAEEAEDEEKHDEDEHDYGLGHQGGLVPADWPRCRR